MTISRRVILKNVALATAATVLSSPINSALATKAHKVIIKDFSFNPKELKIRLGDTVEWKNIDGFLHTATSDTKEHFDTKTISTGNSATFLFSGDNYIGENLYHCEVYPLMKAKIIVEA